MKKLPIIISIFILSASLCFSQEKDESSNSYGEYQDIVEKLQGMWGTFHLPQDLCYFEGKTVTKFAPVWSEDGNPMPGLHYVKSKEETYKIEKLKASEESGYRIILEHGSTYWLLDKDPDVMWCYWYSNGELNHSGSDSLAKSDIAVADLILH